MHISTAQAFAYAIFFGIAPVMACIDTHTIIGRIACITILASLLWITLHLCDDHHQDT